MNRQAVKVNAKAERAIRQGHPWIFDQSITKMAADAKSGDLAIIFDQKKNKVLALGLIDPDSPIRIKIIHLGGAKIDDAFWREKIFTAKNKRDELLKTDTNSYRLIHGENDGLPGLIVDVYADVVVAKIYSGIWLPYLSNIYAQITELLGPRAIVQRLSRFVSQKYESLLPPDGSVVQGSLTDEQVVFKEQGVLFSANVVKGHKTGYFLDHRHNRVKVRTLSEGKTVLDVFSYAGGFSAHAAMGGAKEVTSLDISEQALEMASKNMSLNDVKAKHKVMAVDAFEGLEKLNDDRQKYDVVVVDPPSFAKRESASILAIKKYIRLAELAAPLVRKNGWLVLASCSSRVTSDAFFEACEKGISRSGKTFNIKEKTFHDLDHPITFPEAAYLKCGYWRAEK